MSWQKWDVNLQATYTQPTDIIYDKSALPNSQSFAKDGVITGVMTYQQNGKHSQIHISPG